MSLERKRKSEDVELNLSPMIDVVFLILIYFIVSLEMEPSLDDRLVLADARYSVKQDESALQIYVLPAALNSDGSINPDSTGLIAFADRAGTPDSCLFCGTMFNKEVDGKIIPDTTSIYKKPYVINTKARLIEGGIPEIVDSTTGEVLSDQNLLKDDVIIDSKIIEGKNKFCTNCGKNLLFVELRMIPRELEKARDKTIEKLAAVENSKRFNAKRPLLSASEIETMKNDVALMIKADARTFYGRIVQVVEMARSIGISKFALVTSAESSWSQEHADMQGAFTKKLISEGKLKAPSKKSKEK